MKTKSRRMKEEARREEKERKGTEEREILPRAQPTSQVPGGWWVGPAGTGR